MSKVKDVIECLQAKIAISSMSADNKNYQISMTIGEAKELVSILESEPEPGELVEEIRLTIGTAIQEGRETGYSPTAEEWAKISKLCKEINRLIAENKELEEKILRLIDHLKGRDDKIKQLQAELKAKDEIKRLKGEPDGD